MNTNKLIRCFLALEVPENVQMVLGGIIGRLREEWADVKWTDPANIHLTLKFLGEIPEGDALRVGRALKNLKSKFGIINSGLGRLGAFPSLDRPKVIWAGLSEGADQIREIHREVAGLTASVPQEDKGREFRPHLSLGRIRSDMNLVQLREAVKIIEIVPKKFDITKLTLMKSTLTREGAIHQPLETAELAIIRKPCQSG